MCVRVHIHISSLSIFPLFSLLLSLFSAVSVFPFHSYFLRTFLHLVFLTRTQTSANTQQLSPALPRALNISGFVGTEKLVAQFNHVYIYTHTYTYTHIYTHRHTYIYTYTQIQTLTHTNTHVHKHTYKHMRTRSVLYCTQRIYTKTIICTLEVILHNKIYTVKESHYFHKTKLQF